MAGKKGQRSGGHNAKTTEQHLADGTYQKCRHGSRADHPDNQPELGPPVKPDGLDPIEAEVWDDVAGHLPDGCVHRGDSLALREACRWYYTYRRSMQLLEDDPLDKDARLTATACWDRFWRIARDFGATPVERTRLQAPPGDPKEQDSPESVLNKLAASRN